MTIIPNESIAQEVEALNAIYDPSTLELTHSSNSPSDRIITAILRITPHDPSSTDESAKQPISFLLELDNELYPAAVPPVVVGTESTAGRGKGEGKWAVEVLKDAISRCYTEGEVCLYEVIEEVAATLGAADAEAATQNGDEEDADENGDEEEYTMSQRDLLDEDFPPPEWTLSEPLLEKKSLFVARCCSAPTLEVAQHAISHLIASDKKVAAATHNISAWRIRPSDSLSAKSATGTASGIVQDSDDDGETAAGGRLLHLLQLMDVWNVVVVVTRWYGGVHLGPDRFRCINEVGREAVLKAGFVRGGGRREDGGEGAGIGDGGSSGAKKGAGGKKKKR